MENKSIKGGGDIFSHMSQFDDIYSKKGFIL